MVCISNESLLGEDPFATGDAVRICGFTKSGGQAYLRLKCEDEVRGMKQAAGRQFC
jgi:hypothetical protein